MQALYQNQDHETGVFSAVVEPICETPIGQMEVSGMINEHLEDFQVDSQSHTHPKRSSGVESYQMGKNPQTQHPVQHQKDPQAKSHSKHDSPRPQEC